MTNEARYSYQSYMERLRALLLASGPNAAVVVSDGIAATLGSPTYVYGFVHEDATQIAPDFGEFDFDESAWNGTSWDGETHAQTWSIFLAPTIFTRWP
ncbi:MULTISPECIES: hypothetical protein [Achromobacter]|uniref:Uncharacterized protein n=1 Tax=Achromobacter mucicolens TaxID=1389922 RepID=A0ABM8LK34_9BURK|nr:MULTISPECIES: hypothetical protein [Achromobacter]CAB3846531.1 hypothetical protein LMG3410_01546 [Achromobacter aegrifaciens]CAB3913506.1 hypothetical protein LMG3415_05102 [Achromobacter mucicolens]